LWQARDECQGMFFQDAATGASCRLSFKMLRQGPAAADCVQEQKAAPRPAFVQVRHSLQDGAQPDYVSYNSVINTWAKQGNASGAVRIVRLMCKRDVEPDVIRCCSSGPNLLLGARADAGGTSCCLELGWAPFHEQLPRTGVGTLPCAAASNWGGHPFLAQQPRRRLKASAGTLTCTTLLSALMLVRETQEEMRSGFTRGGKQMLPSFSCLLTSSPSVPS
jgi:pentatricopeptide repeat protein